MLNIPTDIGSGKGSGAVAMDQEKLFTSVEEECLYWKERCLKVGQERNDVQREFDDFTEESRQLEAELEMTVEQQEKKIRDLNQLVGQLRVECESYKRKMANSENESNKIDADYKQLVKENEKFKVYIRELEQKNDDLERANRVASESVAEFESMLNQAYEKNALLELEVDEKERMQIKLQRLMDEARDLKQELKVRHVPKSEEDGEVADTHTDGISSDDKVQEVASSEPRSDTPNSNTTANVCLSSNKLENINNNINSKKTDPNVVALAKSTSKLDLESTLGSMDNAVNQIEDGSLQQKLIIERNGNINSSSALVSSVLNAPMAPSDRVSTLSIVADLLRRLDNMEAKLKAWKIRKPSSRTNLASSGNHRHSQNQLNNHSLHHHSHHLGSISAAATGGAAAGGLTGSGVPADSSVSLNSLGSGGDSCCNVQLHSYQPGMATIGTQTSSQQQQIPPPPIKAELRTNK